MFLNIFTSFCSLWGQVSLLARLLLCQTCNAPTHHARPSVTAGSSLLHLYTGQAVPYAHCSIKTKMLKAACHEDRMITTAEAIQLAVQFCYQLKLRQCRPITGGVSLPAQNTEQNTSAVTRAAHCAITECCKQTACQCMPAPESREASSRQTRYKEQLVDITLPRRASHSMSILLMNMRNKSATSMLSRI